MSSQSKRTIRDEVVLYVAPTPSGYKVERRDGTGLADGFFTKGHTSYFNGDEPKQSAIDYAERTAENNEDYRILFAPQVDND